MGALTNSPAYGTLGADFEGDDRIQVVARRQRRPSAQHDVDRGREAIMGRRGRGLGDAWPDEAVSVWTRGPARLPILPPPYPLDRDSETTQAREWPAERFVGAEFSTAPTTTQTFGPGLGRPVRQPPSVDPRIRQTRKLTAQLGGATRRFTGELNLRPVTGPFGTRPLTGPLGRTTNPVLGQNPLFSRRPVTGNLGQRRVTGPLLWQSPYVATQPARGDLRVVYLILALMAALVVAALFAANVLPPLSAVTDLFGGAPGQSTSQPGAARLLAPLLGSERQEFEALYGASKGQTGDAERYEVFISGRPVLLTVKWGQGIDQRARVFALTATPRAPATGPWDAATADTICNTFLPSDVKLAGAAHGEGYTEYVYTSAALAQAFSSTYFIDDAYKPVPAGTLNRLDHLQSGGETGVASCTITLGRH
jgi:hypothetical protein